MLQVGYQLVGARAGLRLVRVHVPSLSAARSESVREVVTRGRCSIDCKLAHNLIAHIVQLRAARSC